MKVTPQTLEVERPTELFEIEMDDGSVFRLAHSNTLPIEVLSNFPFMTPLERLKWLVGSEQFDALVKCTFGGHPIDGFFFDTITPLYMEHYGMGDSGESGASPGL